MLLPVRCAVCLRPGGSPCVACASELRRAPTLACPAGLDRCQALLVYDGAARQLISRLKFRNARGSLEWLAGAMAALLGPAPGPAGVVTWAPTSAARRHHRGFDQAELLARRVARRLGWPAAPLLWRTSGGHQTGRTRADRWADHPAFTRRADTRVAGGRGAPIVLVDDVVTTGATLAAAARALRDGGAPQVWGLAAACTPARRAVRG